MQYEPYKRGQITKVEAGQLYKAVKNGNVEAKPELVKTLYDETNYNLRFANERYTQDWRFYDAVEDMTRALLNSDYKTAQAKINWIESDRIKRAGKKSIWYKYKNSQ